MLSSGGSDKVVGAGLGRAQEGKGSRGQLGGVNGGVQGKVVNTSLLQGPCSHCSAQGELWAVCHQSMGMRVCTLCMAYQTGNGMLATVCLLQLRHLVSAGTVVDC